MARASLAQHAMPNKSFEEIGRQSLEPVSTGWFKVA